MAKILVSLVSDQTIPNVEFIKENQTDTDKFLFISTAQKRDETQWIIESTQLSENQYDIIEVNAFSITDIETKLNQYPFIDDEYSVNITGGTKLMTLVIEDFFRKIGAKIFYLTGYKKQYLKIFPAVGQREFTLSTKLTLNEYLTAYGFEITPSELFKDQDTAFEYFNFYVSADFDVIKPVLQTIQARRDRNTTISEVTGLAELLQSANFTPEKENCLSKYETRYLTGDWFEEYVYYKIKTELNLSDNEIGTGYKLLKNNIPNEIDVIFIHEHKLYIIECKTSIFERLTVAKSKNETTEISYKDRNLLPEIIYKSDALRAKFGLFASTSIFTLGRIKDDKGEIIKEMKPHIERAELSKISIISKHDLIFETPLKTLLKIQ